MTLPDFYIPEPNTGCWLWTGNLSGWGYGRFESAGKSYSAFRVAWANKFGPIPEGKQLDHCCRVRSCVNPDHLEPVTRKENILRGNAAPAKHARKIACHRSHAFDSQNTRINRDGSRACRACDRIKWHSRKED